MARTLDPEKHAAKRNQILDAAVQCFADRGFHGTSTADICRVAGMSSGNMFHYFPTKDAVVMAIADIDRHQTAEMFSSVEMSCNVVATITNLAEHVIDSYANPTIARLSLELAAEASRNPVIAAMFEDNDRTTKAMFVDLLTVGMRRGEVDGTLDPQAASLWLIALVEGAIGHAAMDASFDPASHVATLKLLITRFLSPQASVGSSSASVPTHDR
jgi:TetR/AcrR family transcriptional regulator, repressor for uid operon